MKYLVLILISISSVFAGPYDPSDFIFPPDGMRSIEELKMKPMVSHEINFFTSGANTLVSSLLRGVETGSAFRGTGGEEAWLNKIEGATVKLMQDYKSR